MVLTFKVLPIFFLYCLTNFNGDETPAEATSIEYSTSSPSKPLSKNLFKYTVNKLLGKNYLLQDLWNIQEIPVSEKLIIQYLNDKNISYRKYSINQVIDNTDSNFITLGEFNSKIVFECIVPELRTN